MSDYRGDLLLKHIVILETVPQKVVLRQKASYCPAWPHIHMRPIREVGRYRYDNGDAEGRGEMDVR